MSEELGNVRKKEIIKSIIKELHQGLAPEKAKEKLEKEAGTLSSAEIAAVEQSLLDEGMPSDEIKEFCNVHALMFESMIKETVAEVDSPAHPVNLFKAENRKIEEILKALREKKSKIGSADPGKVQNEIAGLLEELQGVDIHYQRKEQVLFPYLEKHEFLGPSKVMWGKDDEVRELLRKSSDGLSAAGTPEALQKLYEELIVPLLDETEGMILKEEQILFPAALDKLSGDEWISVLKEGDEAGYVFGVQPPETEQAVKELKTVSAENAFIGGDGKIQLPSGSISPTELLSMLNLLPLDITYVDKDDKVAYFSEPAHRIFLRTRAIIGREVKNCHPPQSVETVERILKAFKDGRRDSEDFWLELNGRFIYIQFFAVRDQVGAYLGCMELTMDATGIRALTGEKRLADSDL